MIKRHDLLARWRRETGVVLDWLLRVVLLLGIGGVLFVEALGVLVAHYSASEGASAAVTQAAFALKTGDSTGDPESLAKAAAERHDCKLLSLQTDPAAGTVSATVQRRARTLFLHRIKSFRRFSVVTTTEDTVYQDR